MMTTGRKGGVMTKAKANALNYSPDILRALVRSLPGVLQLGLLLVAAVVDGPEVVTAQETDDVDSEVCCANCLDTGSSGVFLSDEFLLGWNIQDDYISYTLSAAYIDDEGYMGIGFGGDEMANADDYIICEVFNSTSAECTDRQPVTSNTTPDEDTENSSLNITDVTVDGDWTSVTFYRYNSDLDDDEDYDLNNDLDGDTSTNVIYAYREGEGIGMHLSSDRGASSVNFVTGTSTTVCDEDTDFYLLHGALILSAWLALMPVGIFFARYRKGENEVFGRQWWETHSEIMIIASEMVLPMSITAIITTSGSHDSEHAKWGFVMIAAIGFQLLTGFLRQRALEGKYSNFCLLHRVNKHLHIWTGHFAFLAGAFQCYRGVELVSATDSLVFSAIEDLVEFEFGTFGVVYDYVMPIWFGVVAVVFLFLETRKQLNRFKVKGAAMVCCFYELKNKGFIAKGRRVGHDEEEEHRLMPRTQALSLYSMDEFNHKVLNGMSWVIVDGAILDVGNFSRRHPGGARVIVNALGTDITNELKGEDQSIGHAMSFSPNVHSESAWELARSLVVGYIEEEDDSDSESGGDDVTRDERKSSSASNFIAKRLRSQQAQSVAEPGSVVSHTRGSAGRSNHNIGGGVGEGSAYGANSAKPSSEAAIRAAMIAKAWAKKAGRRGSLNAVPLTPVQTSLVPVAATAFLENIQRNKDRKRFLLQRFHVCPFVLRQRLDRGKEDDRAIYRYVFACPGEAAVLAQAATGVCYFNMRMVRSNGDSVVQRSYNATAVRVIRLGASDNASSTAPPAASVGNHSGAVTEHPGITTSNGIAVEGDTAAAATSSYHLSGTPADATVGRNEGAAALVRNISEVGGGGNGDGGSGIVGGGAVVTTKEGSVRVVPAVESREGALCVEMRIRLYKDGAMSKLLNQLPKDSTNATVQLQGPYLVDSLSPPPAHRNVIMIAAGTGINPMVQLIRDYQSFDSQDSLRTTGRSRLALLWQATTAMDLYCEEELSGLEERGRGLLEITTLVSGNHRKKNDPKAPNAFQRRRKKRADAAAARKAVAAAALEGSGRIGVDRSDRSRTSSGILGRLFSLSPAVSYSTPTEGRAVAVDLPTPASLIVRPQDPDTGAPADGTNIVPEARDACTSHAGGGGIESGAVDNAVISSSSVDVDRAGKEPGVTFTPDHSAGASYSSAAVEVQPRPEGAVDSPKKGGHHQQASSRTRDCSQIFLKDLKSCALPDEPDYAPSLASSSSNFRAIPPIGTKPKALSRPTRDLLQGAHGIFPRRGPILGPHSSCSSSIILEHRKGKVSKEILPEIFGERLMHIIEEFNARHPQTLGTSQEGVERSGRERDLVALCGTEIEPGKLQVVISGPSGFVFHVEHMLEEMGVPKEAVVILD